MVSPTGRRVVALACCCALLVAACAPSGDGGAGADPPDTTNAAPADAPTSNVTDGCVEGTAEGVDHFPEKVDVVEAEGFSVTYHDTYKLVEVHPPDTQDDEALTLVLHQCGAPEPDLGAELADAQVIEVPVAEVVTLTTTNLPHFAELDAVDRLAGVGTGAFVATPEVRERIDAGELEDFADTDGEPDLERLVAAGPDLLIMDGFGDAVLDETARTIQAGIPTALNVDFDESTVLGRAEWLKFTALFWNAEAAATAAYERIADDYGDVALRAQAAGEPPSVFVNAPYEGVWFTPGGQSFLANAIDDAGGAYVFADDGSTGSLELDIEAVLDAASDADVWLQAGSVHGSLDDLAAQDERFRQFEAFTQGEVWAYDLQTTEGGGNAVFETAYTRADLFLADLAKIFHPEEFEDHSFEFFGRVPAEPAG